jgi:hypothetical protein
MAWWQMTVIFMQVDVAPDWVVLYNYSVLIDTVLSKWNQTDEIRRVYKEFYAVQFSDTEFHKKHGGSYSWVEYLKNVCYYSGSQWIWPMAQCHLVVATKELQHLNKSIGFAAALLLTVMGLFLHVLVVGQRLAIILSTYAQCSRYTVQALLAVSHWPAYDGHCSCPSIWGHRLSIKQKPMQVHQFIICAYRYGIYPFTLHSSAVILPVMFLLVKGFSNVALY